MRIQGFNTDQSTVGSFNFRTRNEDAPSRRIEDDSAKTSSAKSVNGKEQLTIINPIDWHKIEYSIAAMVDKKSNELQKGLEHIFKEGSENVLSGKSGLEYDEHIKELAAAIEGQDFKNAEKIIDKFFTGDKDKVIGHVQNLANGVKDSFWKEVRDMFAKDMFVVENRTTFKKGEEPESALPYVQRAIERAKKASAEFDISDKSIADRVASSISAGQGWAKSKLKNAGRNRYSETSESVTHATAQYARDSIFGGDDNSRKEDKTNRTAVSEYLNQTYEITEQATEKLNKANKSKKDDFSKYLFRSGEAYFEALKSELGIKKLGQKEYTTVEDEQAYQESLKSNQGQQGPRKIEMGPNRDINMTLKIQDSLTQQALFSPVKVTELYGNEEENRFGQQGADQHNSLDNWI